MAYLFEVAKTDKKYMFYGYICVALIFLFFFLSRSSLTVDVPHVHRSVVDPLNFELIFMLRAMTVPS